MRDCGRRIGLWHKFLGCAPLRWLHPSQLSILAFLSCAGKYKGLEGESCAQTCQRNGKYCDEDKLTASGTSAVGLSAAVEPTFLCAPPYLATCEDAAPTISGIGDGFCWYREAHCPPRALPGCNSVPVSGFDSGLRLCPCTITPPPLPCLGNTPTISAAGGIYYIDGSITPVAYGAGSRQVYITAGAAHPLRFLHMGGQTQCLPTMTPLGASANGDAGVMVWLQGPLDNGNWNRYYYGNWEATFPSDPACETQSISLMCGLPLNPRCHRQSRCHRFQSFHRCPARRCPPRHWSSRRSLEHPSPRTRACH